MTNSSTLKSSIGLKTVLQFLKIEQYRRNGLLYLKIEQRESKGLSVCKLECSDIFSVFDVEGCACDLFVQGPGNQQHPEEAPSCGERWSGDKVGVFCTTQSPLLAQVAS